VPTATKAPPRARPSRTSTTRARGRTPSTATPPPRRSATRASLIAPQTRPRPPVRAPGTNRRPPAEAPRRATRPEQRHPSGAARPGARRRLGIVVVCGVAIVLTIVGFHAVLAQNQLRIDRLRGEIATAEARYDEARYHNSVLASPERITQRAQEIGLVVSSAPVAVPIVGDVPKRSSSGDVIENYEKVKRHLDASP
jgi:hypothetical protein